MVGWERRAGSWFVAVVTPRSRAASLGGDERGIRLAEFGMLLPKLCCADERTWSTGYLGSVMRIRVKRFSPRSRPKTAHPKTAG